MKYPKLYLLGTALLTSALLGSSSLAQGIRILPMGDSITFGSGGTAGLGGYRGPLYDLLTTAGYPIDYVGTSTGNSALMADMDHEGHGGWIIQQLDDNVTTWFNAIADPDIILLHIGTNDFGSGNDTPNAINRLDALITKMAGLRPGAHVIVTNLMERGEPQNAAIQAQFNPFVQGVVDSQLAAGHRVSFLDMRAAVPLSDMPDNLHPNQAGYDKMAAAWFAAIEAVIEPGDDVPPAIVRALGTTTRDRVEITFNRRLDEASAESAGNYAIDGGVGVLAAELSASGRVVTLTTTPQVLGTTYTLTVNNLQDRVTPTPNTIEADSTTTFFAVTPAGYFNHVDEANCYTLVYSLDIPTTANFASAAVPYNIDNRGRIGSFDRVAYYLELKSPTGDLQYAWASMDAFTASTDEIGVPTASSGAIFQQPADHLNVVSNVPGVSLGDDQQGNLEFWPRNYSAANAAAVPGANPGTLDFGDTVAIDGNYGSMQIHNTDGAQTVIAFNRWGGVGGDADLGIGNRPGTHPDWTFAQNAAGFAVKRLQILVRTTGDLTPPTLVAAAANFAANGITLRFSEPVRPETLLAANFSLDNGASVLGVSFGDDLHEVLLQTTTHPVAPLTLSVSGVRDTSQNANLIAPGSAIAVLAATLPAEVIANIGAAADDYELVYSVDLPTTGNFNAGNPYRVDNSSAAGTFSRVAYYLELQASGGPVEYVWAAMDAFTTNRRQLGVPTVGSGAFFQQGVTNLDVISNAPGIVDGTGLATGNIEFWPSNYNASNAAGITGASATLFDFGDGGAGTSAGYGSMQVHNHGAAQTLFALNRFGVDGNPLCLGIGNRPTAEPDWTFADNAASYTRRVLHVLVLPTAPPPVPAEVLANVPEATGYELVYSLDVPATGNLSGGAGFAPYSVDLSNSVTPFSRVAYYFELEKTGDPGPTFVWVSMDAFTAERSKIGVPNLASGAVWRQLATNLNVVSNSAAITTGTGLDGNLEFWPTNYNATNTLPVPGASAATFDFGDNPTPGNYGSMQVHNYVAGETLFAINSWGRTGNSTAALCVGIGTSPAPVNNGFDWTFADNATDFDLRRRLHVLVLPGTSPLGGPEIAAASGSTTLTRLSLRFDREVSDASASAGNFSLDGGVTVTGATLLPGHREIALTTTAQTAGTTYTVTVNNVRERSAGGIVIQPGSTAQFTAFTPPPVLANVPDPGYELIYHLAIPANQPQWNLKPVTYSIDEAKYGERLFDRVAYLMELDGDWVYTSFDPHTNRIAQIGVPSLQVSPTPFQQIVTNMNVASNFPGIITDSGFSTGNIEFWGGNYSQANALGIPGADPATYDFGDTMTAGGHGSMQVHNHGAAQTLFAYNNWGSNAGGVSDTGIGNNPTVGGNPDWTFSSSASNWTSRNLYILARPGGTPTGDAPEILTHPCDREVAAGSDVTFSVTMLGVGPFTYQWRCNRVPLAGQTSPWLELGSVSAADVASYDVVVTGANLVPTTSLPALLTLTGTQLTALERWRIDNGFHPSDGSGPGGGDIDDRESDNLINLLEFAFGTDPNLSDHATLTADGSVNGTPIIRPAAIGGYEAVFVRRDDHGQPGSLVYTAQFSGDLATFHDSAAIPALVADSLDDPDYEVVKVPFPSTLPDDSVPRFFRVSVQTVP